jgi:hypothetical protein
VSAPKSQYRHVFKANVCACGEVYPRPGNSSFEEAHPYIQLGAFSTEEEMKGYFDQKHQTFVFRIPHSKVEYVKFEFVRGLKKSSFPDYCAPFSNEYLPASDTQVIASQPCKNCFFISHASVPFFMGWVYLYLASHYL